VAEPSGRSDRFERPDAPATRAVHAGEEPASPVTRRPAGSVVYHTAPFVFGSTEELDGAFAAGGREGVYSRFGNPTVRVAEEKLAALEGAEEAVAFASGLAAMSAAVSSCVASGDTIVASTDLYGGTAVQLDRLVRSHPEVAVEQVPLAGLEGRLTDASRPAPRLVILETPSNPLLACCDLAAVAAAARERGSLLLVDNTFATPVLQTPLRLPGGGGADLVVHSATKYLGGHSDATGGFVAGSAERMEPVKEAQMYGGACLDPHAAFLLARGMKTLALRVERQSENAARLAEFLARHPAVHGVRYPGNDPVARRQMRAGGGMLTFELAGAEQADSTRNGGLLKADSTRNGGLLKAAARVVDRLRIFHIIPSLGGVESGVSIPALTSHRSLDPETRRALGIGDGMLRLSVGIEAEDDLRADLEQALEGIV
jgi:cystathionine beta-lyase/cystathionine gamma-synthase